MLTDAEFAIVAREVKARSGAVLTRELANAATMKLMPLARREGFGSAPELIAAARIRPDGVLWNAIADALAQSETRFFRDRVHFDLIRTKLLPAAIARRGRERVRIWSAACATGQEAYSLAMMVDDMRAEGAGAPVEIVASDFSERLIEKARAGLYTQFEVQRGLPIRKLVAHFEKAGDLWRISDRLRAAVQFEPHNLMRRADQFGKFDIIMLCHVLNAVDAHTKLAVIDRAAETLTPGGVIVLGAGESFPEASHGLDIEGSIARNAPQAEAAPLSGVA